MSVGEAPLQSRKPLSESLEVLRVLLVEDNAADARLVEKILSRPTTTECVVRRVCRVSEAASALDEEAFDVVLLDLSLPDARGLIAVRRIQATGTQVPIVVLTGLEDDHLAIDAMREGAQDYLVKGDGGAHTVSRAIRCAIERKKAERNLAHLALHDPLTGLGNRTLYGEKLEQALVRARRGGTRMAVLFLDLDYFKEINDTLGHDIGDQLLQSVADRMRNCVRDTDTVARLGGDEFAAVLEGLSDVESASVVARKTLVALQQPFSLSGLTVDVTPSIGVAVYPEGGSDIDELTKNADAAMYEVKEQGRNGYHVYSHEVDEAALRRTAIEHGLRVAFNRNELALHFQPRVDLASRTVTGAQALLRWHSSELGSVPANEFIQVAGQVGLIGAIGEWAVNAACAQYAAWRDAGFAPVRISVKVSCKQFQQTNIKELVCDALAASQMPPGQLELEVTEELLVADDSDHRSQLSELKAMGVGIMVEHFARGYTSFRDLLRWPVDSLKLDRSYLRDTSQRSHDARIGAAIMGMAKSLNLKTVAEAVESDAQQDFVFSHGGEEAQGHLFCPALPPDQFLDFVESTLATRPVS